METNVKYVWFPSKRVLLLFIYLISHVCLLYLLFFFPTWKFPQIFVVTQLFFIGYKWSFNCRCLMFKVFLLFATMGQVTTTPHCGCLLWSLWYISMVFYGFEQKYVKLPTLFIHLRVTDCLLLSLVISCLLWLVLHFCKAKFLFWEWFHWTSLTHSNHFLCEFFELLNLKIT